MTGRTAGLEGLSGLEGMSGLIAGCFFYGGLLFLWILGCPRNFRGLGGYLERTWGPKVVPKRSQVDTFGGLGAYLGSQGGPQEVPRGSKIDIFEALGGTWGPKVVPRGSQGAPGVILERFGGLT